jgi:urease accessory protein
MNDAMNSAINAGKHPMTGRDWRRAIGIALWLCCVAAWVHDETGQAAGFLSGLSHPVSGMDHVLAMVAVGLWGAVHGPPAIWVLPVSFSFGAP